MNSALSTMLSPPPPIFDLCRPRSDVIGGSFSDADFAADLASVVRGSAHSAYGDPERFFSNTYPTQGLRALLTNVCSRLSGAGEEAARVFRLDTAYGGGKTHGLIALAHAAKGMRNVDGIADFVDPLLLPKGQVRVAAFDGENADPANGRDMGHGIRARTPWGEIAYLLAGAEGYRRVAHSDQSGQAPGSETLRGLFGGQPVLILVDELSVYLRKVGKEDAGGAQLTAFLSSLIKAVETAPRAALVYTLALGKGGVAQDAYRDENEYISERMAELESVSARKATLLNPTRPEETVHVLRRRLFESIDDSEAREVVAAYRRQWTACAESLPSEVSATVSAEEFQTSYPFHPELLETLTGKTATLSNFQRVRGMLRLLVRTIRQLWRDRPSDATAIHVHHIDLGARPIRQEIVTRLGQQRFDPAIDNDIAGGSSKKALAQVLDEDHHRGLPPLAQYVARTIFVHTLAFNEPLKGVAADRLRFSMLCPQVGESFIEEARRRFVGESAYLDDRPGAPMRFLAQANLQQIIRNETRHSDAAEVRTQLRDRIREVFQGSEFSLVFFPGGPYDVPDNAGSGKPRLIVLSYDGLSLGAAVDRVPKLIRQLYTTRGAHGAATRMLRNNLVFVVASEPYKDEMRKRMGRHLALMRLAQLERRQEFEPYQQNKIRDLASESKSEVSKAILHCYRHIFYPSRASLGHDAVLLAHTAIDAPGTSYRPGAGQDSVVRVLQDLGKLRCIGDQPNSPTYIRDKTQLRKGEISTAVLRAEFRENPDLPIILNEDVFLRGIEQGIERGKFVYRSGELLYGPGDPTTTINVDEQSQVLTIAYATRMGIWPRPEPDAPPEPPKPLKQRTAVPELSAHAEGLLGEALLDVWEKARRNGLATIATIAISIEDTLAGLGLLSSIGAVRAKKKVRLDGGYETEDSGFFNMEFEGSIGDAGPVKDFLMPQLRAAARHTMTVRFKLSFPDGLEATEAKAKELAARLTRFSRGSTSVHISAEGKP